VREIKFEGLRKSDRQKILKVFKEVGLEEGAGYDKKKIEDALVVAQNRLQTFLVEGWRVEEDENDVVLKIRVDEQGLYRFRAAGGGGNMGAFVGVEGGFRNLRGGGEKLYGAFNWRWFYGGGYRSFSFPEGRIVYHDPQLFSLFGKSFSGEFAAEMMPRMNYVDGSREIMMGGRASIGMYVTPRSQLALTPSFYYIKVSPNCAVIPSYRQGGEANSVASDQKSCDRNPSYFRQGFKFEFRHDRRNNFLTPTSGYYFSTFIEPGLYWGGSGGTAGFLTGGAAYRKYFSLPWGFSVMAGLKGMVGYNLRGGDQFFLGNGFIRNNNNTNNYGKAAVAGSLELRWRALPITDYLGLTSPEVMPYLRMMVQPYVFLDGGCAFRSYKSAKCGFGTGVGLRVIFLGMLFNLTFGFPTFFGWNILAPGEE